MPWIAKTRLHLTLQANNTVEVHLSREYICNCTSYEFVLEPNVENIILLKSNSSVSGKFSAWQEIPREKQILAIGLIFIGLIGVYSTDSKELKKTFKLKKRVTCTECGEGNLSDSKFCQKCGKELI